MNIKDKMKAFARISVITQEVKTKIIKEKSKPIKDCTNFLERTFV